LASLSRIVPIPLSCKVFDHFMPTVPNDRPEDLLCGFFLVLTFASRKPANPLPHRVRRRQRTASCFRSLSSQPMRGRDCVLGWLRKGKATHQTGAPGRGMFSVEEPKPPQGSLLGPAAPDSPPQARPQRFLFSAQFEQIMTDLVTLSAGHTDPALTPQTLLGADPAAPDKAWNILGPRKAFRCHFMAQCPLRSRVRWLRYSPRVSPAGKTLLPAPCVGRGSPPSRRRAPCRQRVRGVLRVVPLGPPRTRDPARSLAGRG